MGDARAVGAQIRMRLPSLTPLEGKVVADILARKDVTDTIPLRDVAQGSGVSEAMVVKVAKKLGFAGFRDFRQGLVDYYNSDTAALHSEIGPQDTAGQIVQKVFRTAMQALEETFAILDLEAFERAADFLHRARQRDFYGLGGSAQIARDVSHKFLRIGIRTSVFDDAHMMVMSAALLGHDDVAVAFSHSGSTTAVIEAVELARRNGARTIAVTNYARQPAREDRRCGAVFHCAEQPASGRKRHRADCAAEPAGRAVRGRGATRPGGGGRQSEPDHARRSDEEKAVRKPPVTRPTVLVVGSLHYDIMVEANHLPRRDETAVGSRWYPKFGGKGGNQAVSCALQGMASRFLGAVGTDDFGRFLTVGLTDAGVDTRFLRQLPDVGSGMSVAIQDGAGDYAATIVSGANLSIDPAWLADDSLWDGVALLVLQNEVPEPVNLAAATEAHQRGVRVVLNAAPFRPLSKPFERLIDILVVNAVEAEMMGAEPVCCLTGASEAAHLLASRYDCVIVTAGAKGLAVWASDDSHFQIAAEKVEVASSHGAGDAFIGALAAALCQSHTFREVCETASKAAARHVSGQSGRTSEPLPQR